MTKRTQTRTIRHRIFSLLAVLLTTVLMHTDLTASTLRNTAVFDKLDLSRSGLEAVRSAYAKGDKSTAATELLKYYRERSNVKHPTLNRLDGKTTSISITEAEQKRADDSLEHIFYAHRGYKPYFYGKDINWQFWPVKDNELRFQLHRMYWWDALGKAYWKSGDEKYARAWADQYQDWIRKNPRGLSKENDSFAWRALEVSHRVENQTSQFEYFLNSESFTPQFLLDFLDNYYRHADYLRTQYSERGNHLLFEAQRILTAGTYFPEFKDAPLWRQEGIDILNREINRQVFADGWQFELDPGYHIAAIQIFSRGLNVLSVNGIDDQFPDSFKQRLEQMVHATADFTFPDYTYPIFSDAKLGRKSTLLRQFREWSALFPENQVIAYFASDGRRGKAPAHLSAAYTDAGIYTLRSGWKPSDTVMVLKAGPPAFWHSQPDNGTFELYINGRNFFPDSGSYVYGGDAQVLKERDWFRQSAVHNTLTLNNRDITVNAKLLHWDATNPDNVVLVYENPSYERLNHRRSVFFLDKKYFVIVDEAIGSAQGRVGIHFAFKEGKVNADAKNLSLQTTYPDGNNIQLRVSPYQKAEVKPEEGYVSYAYRQKQERPAFVFQSNKNSSTPTRFITTITPAYAQGKAPEIEVRPGTESANAFSATVSIDGKAYDIGYTLPR